MEVSSCCANDYILFQTHIHNLYVLCLGLILAASEENQGIVEKKNEIPTEIPDGKEIDTKNKTMHMSSKIANIPYGDW